MRDGRPTSPTFAIGFSPVFGESAASIPNGEVKPLPTAQKDRIYYGKQAQFNAYKRSLWAQQEEQQMAGI